MKRLLTIFTLVLALVLVSSGAVLADTRTYVTHLTGSEEVPAGDTLAQGQAIFRLNKDGTELYYKLIVANIDDVTAAHIHLAAAGVNGPVVAPLYVAGPISGRFSGVLAEGVITSLSGPLAGLPLSHLIEYINSGDIYVNVHTTLYPGGEIRGQID